MNVQISRLLNIGLAFIVLLIAGSLGKVSGQAQPAMAGYSISGRVTDGSDTPISGIVIKASINFNLVFVPALLNEGTNTRALIPAVPAARMDTGKTGSSKSAVSSRTRYDQSILSAMIYSTTTDLDGNYNFSGLPTGVYTVTVSQTGFAFTPATRRVAVPPDSIIQNFTRQGGEMVSISPGNFQMGCNNANNGGLSCPGARVATAHRIAGCLPHRQVRSNQLPICAMRGSRDVHNTPTHFILHAYNLLR